MSKRPSFGIQFEKLKSLGGGKPLEEWKPAEVMKAPVSAPEGQTASRSSILEESLSSFDSVQNEQSSKQTVSKIDTVQTGQCAESTVSIGDSLAAGFTRVPHSLLRGEGKFSEPLDFMIYMHLFTYSHGFGRREAHMSQSQLEKFTGATKNTIKRSLDRLTAQGWIKCIEEYERARMSRKWRVLTPEDRTGRSGSGGKRTGSKTHTVQNEQCAKQTGSLSKTDPPTGSKTDTFLETIPKEKTKNSLSVETPMLREYFAAVKPFGKRESEWKAYQGLRQDFTEAQIAACAERLLEKGIPNSGAPCHSPMGFLSKAMGQVWSEVQREQDKIAKLNARAEAAKAEELRREREANQAEADAARREAAFVAAYRTASEQNRIIEMYRTKFPGLNPAGPVLRTLGIGAWWEAQQNQGAAFATG